MKSDQTKTNARNDSLGMQKLKKLTGAKLKPD